MHFGAPQLESEQLQDHLSTLSKRLSRALTMTRPDRPEDHEVRRIQVTVTQPEDYLLQAGQITGSLSIQ